MLETTADRFPASSGAPAFVIVGAQRGGTTSLYRYLAAHPGVLPASRKELHYFTNRHDRGPDWYRSQFPPTPPGTITGESTPYYLFHPHAPRRLHAFAPDVKLIVLLRNPVDRAYSHYQLQVRRRHETLPFEEAIAREEERLAGELQNSSKMIVMSASTTSTTRIWPAAVTSTSSGPGSRSSRASTF